MIGLGRQRRLIESAKAVFAELNVNDFRIAPGVIKSVLERRDCRRQRLDRQPRSLVGE